MGIGKSGQRVLQEKVDELEEENMRLRRMNSTLRQQGVDLLDMPVPECFSVGVHRLDPLAVKVLSFWFGTTYDVKTITPKAYDLWFGKSVETDDIMSKHFKSYLAKAAEGKYDHWAKEPLGVVALLLLLDQFPRNIYRNTAGAYRYDWKAGVIAHNALQANMDARLHDLEKVWIYLVLTHTEDLTSQKLCVKLAEENLLQMDENYRQMWKTIFQKHLLVIERFGRFPHRNTLLGRPSTPEEETFVKDPLFRFDLPVKFEIDPQTNEAKFIFLSQSSNSRAQNSPQRWLDWPFPPAKKARIV